MLVRSKHFKIGQNSLQVKIFLIACSIKEAEKLYTALEYRSDIGLVCIDKLLNSQLEFFNGNWQNPDKGAHGSQNGGLNLAGIDFGWELMYY